MTALTTAKIFARGELILRSTDAAGGRERPCQGPRLLGRQAAQKEVVVRCRPPWEQVQGAFSAAALRTAFSRQGAVRGRASWPRLRRHLADKIGLPLPKDDRGAVLIKNPQDVKQSSVELCS
jgi:hypothetical protein